jgi:putative transposase
VIRGVWEEKGKKLYGARKVWKQLRRDGVDVARCTVERLMRAQGMVGVVACRRRARTTIPGEESARPRDLVQRDFRAPAPESAVAHRHHLCRAGRWRVLLHRVRH